MKALVPHTPGTIPSAITLGLVFMQAICMGAAKDERLCGERVYYVAHSPSSLSTIDPDSLALCNTIPLEAGALQVLLGAASRHAYVLHTRSLSVVDLKTNRVLKNIPLGGTANDMFFSKDKRLIICVGRGHPRWKNTPREAGFLTTIDTETNEVKASLRTEGFLRQAVISADAAKIFVLNAATVLNAAALEWGVHFTSKGEPALEPALSIFKGDAAKPESVLKFANWPDEMALSPDQRWLYVLESGQSPDRPGKNRNGAVHVIDVAANTLVKTHDVGTPPSHLQVDSATNTDRKS